MTDLIATISTHLLVPLLFAVWLGSSSRRSRWEWAIDAWLFWGYVVLIFLVGSWTDLAYGLRYLPPVALFVATFRAGRRLPQLPSGPPRWRRASVLIVLALGLTFAASQALIAQTPGLPTVPLEFPMRDGTFCTLEGGRHAWVNRFAVSDSGRASLELARLDRRGRVDGRTEVAVLSPLRGAVVAIQDDEVELVGWLPVGGKESEVRLWLWPLTGLAAEVGDSVDAEARLGSILPGADGARVLRLAARVGGLPTPITFAGYYLARNDLFRAPSLPKEDRLGEQLQ